MDTKKISIKFDFPTSWRHGRGLAGQVGKLIKQIGCQTPLLLTDKLLLSLNVVRPVTESLDSEKISHLICDEVNIEPTVDLFESIVKKIDLKNFDAIVAVGGGSVIDVAKGLSVIGSFGGHIRDFAGFDKVPAVPAMKVIAIPTTSGTGSEISDGVVLIDEAHDTKFLVISKKICPTVALTDPHMTVSMPPRVTACSGVDALVHAIESYVSKGASPATEPFALKAIELLSQGIKPACENGADIDVREKMQIGATLAMTAGMNSYLGLCHAMAMPLCALYHMPHGQAVGMALPAVLGYNAQVASPKIIDIMRVMGFMEPQSGRDQDLDKALSHLKTFLQEIGIYARLKDFGYHDSQTEVIVQATLNSAQRPTNPRDPSQEDIAGIVRQMIS